jgi:ABC-type multidrug transport system ATPase subunit
MSDLAIEARGLVKRFGDRAPSTASISRCRGAIHGLLGPNGAGRTTAVQRQHGRQHGDLLIVVVGRHHRRVRHIVDPQVQPLDRRATPGECPEHVRRL